MGLEVIHRAAPEAVESVVVRLDEAGVEAVVIDEPGFLALLFAFGTYRVRIGVPAEQADEARRVMDEWDAESGPAVRDLARELRGQLALAGAIALVFGVVLFFVVDGWNRIPWITCGVPAVFLLSFLGISLYLRNRKS